MAFGMGYCTQIKRWNNYCTSLCKQSFGYLWMLKFGTILKSFFFFFFFGSFYYYPHHINMIIERFASKVGSLGFCKLIWQNALFYKNTMWQDKFIQRKNRHRKEKRQEKRRKNILIYTSFIPVFITILTFFLTALVYNFFR